MFSGALSTRNTDLIWKYVKQKRYDTHHGNNNSTLPIYMKDTHGKILPTPVASAQVWHDSRRTISTAHATLTPTSISQLQRLHGRVLQLHRLPGANADQPSHLNTQFTEKELNDILKNTPNGKAPGHDGIPFEVLKCTRKAFGPTLLKIYNYIWTAEVAPRQWDTAVIHMLYKKHDPLVQENYRAIVLISTLKKIYEGLISNRLIAHIQQTECLHKNQFGFLPERNTTEAIYYLTETIRLRHSKYNRPTYTAFIDFKTAFPNTCRPALWSTLHEHGVTGRIWNNLQKIYAHTRGRVLHPLIKESDSYDINIGLLEGSRLSPILYSFLANSLLKRLHTKYPHLCIDTAWYGAVMYADDLALVADSQEELQNLLHETQLWAEEHFAQINTDKSHTMVFMENALDKITRRETQPALYIKHEFNIPQPISQLKEVDKFRYLGLLLDTRLHYEVAVKDTIRNFWYAHGQTSLLDTHVHGLHPKYQIMLWKQLIWTTTDTCLPFIHDKNHMAALDDQIDLSLASFFCPKPWNTDCLYKALLAKLGIPSAETMCTVASFRVYSHISQQQDTMPAKAILIQWAQHILAKPAAVPHTSMTVKVHQALQQLGHTHDWHQHALTLTDTDKGTAPTNLRTKRRRWIFQLAGKLAKQEHSLLKHWASSTHTTHHISHTSHMSCRAAQYMRSTDADHEARLITLPIT
jgi:hypothetical protein